MRDVTAPIFPFAIVLWVGMAATALLPSRALAQPGWSVGVRGEYVALGGDQLATFVGGYGGGAFIRRPLSDVVSLELGGRVSRHRQSILCFSDKCVSYARRTFTEVYIRPA